MSPSTEYDAYAYLAITCQAPLAEVEEWMGAAGERRSWSAGDSRGSPKYKPYSFTRWTLLSGVDPGLPLDRHLRAL